MRRFGHKGRVDENQKQIVKDLRKLGVSVQILATLGDGCPDLLCGYAGFNILLEVKQPGKKLTEDEAKWFSTWNGTVQVIETTEQAMAVIHRITDPPGSPTKYMPIPSNTPF